MSKGVLYIASGTQYIEEAKKSAKSLKSHNPSLPVTIYTDKNIEFPAFDQVFLLEDPIDEPGDSILSRKHFPYDQNLYLDADTYVCENILEVFKILNKSDVAMAHAPLRTQWPSDIYKKNNIDIPDAFTEYNSGVVAYNDCTEVRKLFDRWKKEYDKFGNSYNQPALRVALYHSNIDISTLPPEYNFMAHIVGYACGEIKIIHSNSPRVESSRVNKLLNNNKQPRVVTWDDHPFRVVPHSYQSRKYKLKDLIQSIKRKQKRDGTASLIRAVISRLFQH